MEEEFINIISDIISERKFLRLRNEKHHTTNRYAHSYSVAYETYKICKKHNLDYVSATRAAIVHDFFFNEEFRGKTKKEILKGHPKMAITNANKIINLSKKEMQIISSHMFPVGGEIPKSREALVVDYADDLVSIREVSSDMKYKIKQKTSDLKDKTRIRKLAKNNF